MNTIDYGFDVLRMYNNVFVYNRHCNSHIHKVDFSPVFMCVYECVCCTLGEAEAHLFRKMYPTCPTEQHDGIPHTFKFIIFLQQWYGLDGFAVRYNIMGIPTYLSLPICTYIQHNR